MSNAFAVFRLPYARQAFRIEGEAQVIPSLRDLGDRQGFVIAPFVATDDTPILLVSGASGELRTESGEWRVESGELRTESGEFATAVVSDAVANSQFSVLSSQFSQFSVLSSQLDSYPFSTFHTALLSGRFQKLVLARCAVEANDGHSTPMMLFERACQRYPRMFIALVSAPQCGTWLTATPEVLLENLPQSDLWRTIALAGTMRLRDDELDGEGLHLRWSTKNIQEQRYVASYIADTLKRLGLDYREEGPRTVRAANLVHLRSDFTFSLSNNGTRVGALLDALHPTPAVCGLPKKEALEFILQNEPVPRRYYCGFMGPVNSQCSTHLYVTLRCMQIASQHYRLYAGGGLLCDSVCDKEWRETEAKMETMRQIVNP